MDKFMNACLIGSLVFMLGLASAGTYEFGSKVAPGDTDIRNLLYNAAPTFMFWDKSGNGYSVDDQVYLHLGNTGCDACSPTVSADDIRITPNGELSAGTKVADKETDMGMPLTSFSSSKIVFLDLDGSGYDLGDPVYLHIGDGTRIVSNDIRLNNIDGLDAGTKIGDFNPDKIEFDDMPFYKIRFFNENGNYALTGAPIYDTADSVYLDISLPPDSPFGFVSVNDLRLSV